MKIIEIRILEESRKLLVTINNYNRYILQLGYGEDELKYNVVEYIAKHMKEKKDSENKADRRVSKDKLITDVLHSEKKFKTHSYQWHIYTNDDRYGEKYPFALYRNDELIIDKKFRHNFATAFFKHKKENKEMFYWLGDYETTEIGIGPLLDEDIDRVIFKENNKKYIRFLAGNEDFDSKLFEGFEGFHITPPRDRDINYIYKFYIPREENNLLSECLRNGENVLIKGPSKIGKTRLVFEELKNFDQEYYVLSLNNPAFRHIDELVFSDEFNKEKRKLIWFIDDLHELPLSPLSNLNVSLKADSLYFSDNKLRASSEFYDPIWELFEKFSLKFGGIIVIGILRSDKNFESQLLKYMKVIEIKKWDKEKEKKEITDLFKYYNEPISNYEKFDGSPFSIIGSIEYMKKLYKSNEISLNAKWSFRYLKLLKEFLPIINYNLLKETFLYLRETTQTSDDFTESIEELDKLGFINREKDLIFSWETYLEEIVCDKDYIDIDLDLKKLSSLFINTNKIHELYLLIIYFNNRKLFEISNNCLDKLIKTTNDKNILDSAFTNWSSTLHAWYNENKDLKLLIDECSKYKSVIKYKKNFINYFRFGLTLCLLADANDNYRLSEYACKQFELANHFIDNNSATYYYWGNALYRLANKRKKEELFKDSCKKFEKTIELNPNHYFAYYGLASSLFRLAEIKNKEELYEDAYNKYNRAIDLRPDIFFAYHGCGSCLVKLADIGNKEELYKDAYEKFKLLLDIKPDYPDAYFWMGSILIRLANRKDDEKLYRNAYEKIKLGLKIKSDDSEAYFNSGIALYNLAKKNNDDKLYKEACKNYGLATEYNHYHFDAYYNWGVILFELAEKNKDDELYKDAYERFQSVINIKSDYSNAYNYCGYILLKFADKKNNIKLYMDACKKFFLAFYFDQTNNSAKDNFRYSFRKLIKQFFKNINKLIFK